MSKNIKIGNDILQDVTTIKFEDAENPGQFVEFLDTTDANATAGEILSGKTGYVNGTKITGTIPSKTAQTYTPTTTDQTIASGQYLSGTQTVLGDANLVAGNIKKDVSIFGITGTHEGGVTPTGTISITSNGSVDVTNYATAEVEVVSGYSVTPNSYGNTVEIGGESTGGYSITTSVTGGTYTGSTATLPAPNTAQVTITASSGYVLPNSVSVSGASFVYNNSTGVIDLTNATGDVTITAVCLAQYTITGNITNGSLTGDSTIIAGGTATVNIVGNEGYAAPTDLADITVTNATKVSIVAGELTISNPTGNVTITASCVQGMAKGTILNIDMTGSGTAQQYRVVKTVTSDIVEVVSMADVNSSIAFDSGSTNTYEGKTLDTYLNTTWYDTLSTTAKNALVAKTFTQDSWYWGTSGNPDYQGQRASDNYQISLGNASYGNSITRKVYALSVQDIIDYLGVTPEMTIANTTLTYNNIWQMFWNDTSSHSGQILWLRSADASGSSAAFNVGGGAGNVGSINANISFRTRAAFQVDLSKISWTR